MELAAGKEIAHEEHTYDEAYEMSEVVQPVDVRNKNNPYANVRDIQDLNLDLHRPQSIGFKRDGSRLMKGATVVLVVNTVVLIAVIIFLGIREGTDQSSQKVYGRWSTWGSWNECSASCGTGMSSRNRSCSNPKPSNGGDHCFGESMEYQSCNTIACPGISVGFSVYAPVSGTGGGSSTLKFSHVVENSAGAFNMTTGEFVCQQPGLYFFSTTVLRSTNITQAAYCFFYKNGIGHKYVAGYAADAGSDFVPSGTNAILYHLRPGDKVYLRNCANSNYFDSASSFTGFLVHADN